jgi:diguanylate cyclase (GGDEF)-like protein/PAS domain S-box-containing protein
LRPLALALIALAVALRPVPAEPAPERITAAALRHWPPQYQMAGGAPAGFAIDVMDAVAERAGLDISYRMYDTWPEVHRALRRGQVDVVPNMGITPTRQAFARFTVPVETFPVVWFVRRGSTVRELPDLRRRSVAVVAANVAERLLGDSREIEVRTFASLEEAVFSLLNGEVDALVYPEPVVTKLLRESGLRDRVRVVGEPLVEIRRGIAVHRELADVHQRLNKAARGFVGSEAYRRLYTQWYGQPEPWWTPAGVAWAMGSALALVVLVLLGWRYRTMARYSRRLQEEMAGRRRAEAAERLAARAMDEAAEGVVITDAEGRVRQVNQAFSRITGFEPAAVEGRRLSGMQEEFPDLPGETVAAAGHWQGEVRIRRRDGESFPAWQTVSTVRDEAGAITHFVFIFNDISELKASQEELDRLAHRDALTGLPNRLLFTERLEQALRRARRESSSLAVLFLDLDGFKHVNDAFGHYVGDELLQAVAERLREGSRETDTLARMGGDEFILLVERLQRPEDAAVVAQKAIDRLAAPFDLHGHGVSVEGSIGISLYPEHGTDVPTLIKHADAAMYGAKSSGRNQYRFFRPELTVTAAERVHLQESVARALDEGGLRLAFRPVVSLADGAITGLEAAVRLADPERGLLEAEDFLEAVQGTRLMARLADWVLTEACRQAAEWQTANLPVGRLVVATAAAQITRTDLVATVERALRETGLEPARLQLDLPEAAVAGLADQLAEVMHRVNALGVGWGLAGFGSSTCSLGMLRDLPLAGLKLAPRFVRTAPADERDRRVVEAVVALGRNLGLAVAADGVVTPEQLEAVRAAGCREAQGPYLHPLLSPDEVPALLAGPAEGD